MSPCGEFGFPLAGFEKARQAWAGCGRAARSAILLYAQARKARRRPEIAAVFFEPNSSTLPGMNHQTWVAGIARVRNNYTTRTLPALFLIGIQGYARPSESQHGNHRHTGQCQGCVILAAHQGRFPP